MFYSWSTCVLLLLTCVLLVFYSCSLMFWSMYYLIINLLSVIRVKSKQIFDYDFEFWIFNQKVEQEYVSPSLTIYLFYFSTFFNLTKQLWYWENISQVAFNSTNLWSLLLFELLFLILLTCFYESNFSGNFPIWRIWFFLRVSKAWPTVWKAEECLKNLACILTQFFDWLF